MYIDLISKLNKVCFSFWKIPRFAMVGNEWVKFTGEELKGDYLYDASLATTRNLSRAERKVEAMMMLSRLMAVPGIDIQAAFKYLQDAASDPAFERILAPIVSGNQNQNPAGGASPAPAKQGAV